ncbi:MAG: hypothetical protein HWE27_18785 [Gammaproteobacteria bacterium]|nr:hypothetical protein [Gammaproteobacteria bacterium]
MRTHSSIIISCLCASLFSSNSVLLNAEEVNGAKPGKVWVGKYVTNKISPKMNEQHEINTVCQKIKTTESHPLGDITNQAVELDGRLTEDYFVIRYSVPAKELHLIKHNSQMFCAIEVATEKKGTFLSRAVTFVTGNSAVTEKIKIQVAEPKEDDDSDKEEKEVEVFRCIDKRGNPVFKDSPCEA